MRVCVWLNAGVRAAVCAVAGDDVSLVLDVEGFLESLTLEQYWPAFSSAGYAELSTLRDVTEADLQVLEIKAGHIKKLLKNLEKLQSKMLHSPGPAHLAERWAINS